MVRRNRLPVEQRFDLKDPNTYVVCAICGGVFENLTQHINNKHAINGKDYLKKYGGTLRSSAAAKRHADTLVEQLKSPERRKQYRQIQLTAYSKIPKEILVARHGHKKEKHALWGKHQSEDSKIRNSNNNKIASAKLKEKLIAEGKWEEYVESRVHRGSDNGMFGRTPPKGAGRCHYFDYTSSVSGKTFLLQGSFEVRMAKIFDKLKCCWEKTKDRFGYTYKGVDRSYNPDFKVIRSKDRVFYYETKGYINEEALVKFEAVRSLKLNFIVVDKKRLEWYERHLGIR